MGRGSSKAGGTGGGKLQAIAVNPSWAYQPDDATDPNDIVKNPIPFVGEGEDWRIGELLEDGTIQSGYIADYTIDISKVKTLQPFVLRSGIQNYQRFDNNDKPYVAELNGEYYLLDGNHRMAIAKLNGAKTMNVILSRRKEK